ncbi:unnamed protein product, partial [Rotaria sordida]
LLRSVSSATTSVTCILAKSSIDENILCFVNCLIRQSLSIVTSNSIVPSSFILICIVGSGPSNYLLTLRHTMPAIIDIIEKLSPFFYPVRDDDVVSEHLEVKNVIQIFTKIVEHEHVKELQEFYYNICL